MAKKMKKNLLKTGSTVAVAVAMSSVISLQAHAAETEEILATELPPVEITVESATSVNNEVLEPAETNEAIAQDNTQTAAENTETAEQNEQVVQENNAAAENNELNSDGALPDPGLELPEAPVIPDTEGMGAEDYNEAIGDYNEGVDGYNDAVDSYNQGVDEYNSAAGDYDQQAQVQYEKDKAAYDEAVAAHETVEEKHEAELQQYEKDSQAYRDYQAALEAYEQAKLVYDAELEQYQVDQIQYEKDSQAYRDYQTALEIYEQAKLAYDAELEQYQVDQPQYEKDSQAYQAYLDALAKYEDAKTTYDADQKQYELDYKQYETDKAAYASYLTAKAAYDTAYENYQKAMTQYELDNAAYQVAYQDYLTAKGLYDQSKAEFDKKVEAYQQENQIYNEVTAYNQQVEDKNTDISGKNTALENDLHSGKAENIDTVGEINKNVTADAAVMEILNGHDELSARHTALQEEAAALENHAGKNAQLGTQEYADYLAAVEAYNEKVSAYNASVDDYNAAVDAYNASVDTYNTDKPEIPSNPSTGDGTTQGTGASIDWGNIRFDTYGGILTHIDVKYNAAASKDVTTDAEGNKTYSDSVTQYDVTGVYTNKGTAEAEMKQDEEDRDYGLVYSNDGWKTSKEQVLHQDAANDEFGNVLNNHLGENLDPVNGEISFYVTLTDDEGKDHGITVNIDANSVYANGSYYKAEANDFLANYVGKNNRTLTKVKIDNVEYYDISGESVYLISALTCDGMTNWWGLQAHGLDLILNMQTMIEIHQADNAEKISYFGYELGRTAQATAPVDPGTFTGNPPKEPDEPKKPTFTMEEPTLVEEPEEPKAPTAPTAPVEVPDPGDPPVEPIAPTPPVEVPDPGNPPTEPTPPTPPGEVPDPGLPPVAPAELDQSEPVAPAPAVRLNYVESLEKLEEKIIVEVVPEIPAEPDGGDDVKDNDPVVVSDQEVPLAKAPKTGDLSALWAAISALSVGGMTFLNRKRRDEE